MSYVARLFAGTMVASVLSGSSAWALDAQDIATFEIENISLLSTLSEAQQKLKSRGYRIKQNIRGHTLSYELRLPPPQPGFNRITLTADNNRIVQIAWKHIDPQVPSDGNHTQRVPVSSMTDMALSLLCDPLSPYPDECTSRQNISSVELPLELHARRYTPNGAQYRAQFRAVFGVTSWVLKYMP